MKMHKNNTKTSSKLFTVSSLLSLSHVFYIIPSFINNICHYSFLNYLRVTCTLEPIILKYFSTYFLLYNYTTMKLMFEINSD